MEGMKTSEPLSSSFPIRSSARSLRSEARPAVLPPGERARRSACPFPRRGTARMSMSFHKMYVCTSMLWINIKQNKVIERNISGERSSQNTQLSWERKEGLIMFSPLQFIVLLPGTLRGMCPCLWSRGRVPLLLRHCGDWDHGDRTWIWQMGWRPARPISTCILQI